MELIAAAESVQKIASVFNKFLDPVAAADTEVTAIIAECFAISSALRELRTAIRDPQYSARYNLIAQDIENILRSLQFTLNDINRFLGILGDQGFISKSEAYRFVWRKINDFFLDEANYSLCRRLEYYRIFSLGLANIIQGYGQSPGFGDLQYRIEKLLRSQNRKPETNLGNMSLGSPVQHKKSWERRKPSGIPRPQTPVGLYTRSNYADPVLPGFDEYLPPYAPDVPGSPAANTTYSLDSSNTSMTASHWVPVVFDQSRPTTGFHDVNQVSACFGPDMPGATFRLAQEHEKLIELPFETGELVVRFYVRDGDLRARIHCKTVRSGRPRTQCCLPLTRLRISRAASNLQLSRQRASGRPPELWATLRFPSYERMILFYCTFLALKGQDIAEPVVDLPDTFLKHEDEIFAGLIVDDNYEHALRIFKDVNSRGIRLQASVHRGEMKKTPIWTAFITHLVTSPSWMAQDGPFNVHLADLQRYVFNNDYTPQLSLNGKHELSFTTSRDAIHFMEAIDYLADGRA